jgi:hypothetical protein
MSETSWCDEERVLEWNITYYYFEMGTMAVYEHPRMGIHCTVPACMHAILLDVRTPRAAYMSILSPVAKDCKQAILEAARMITFSTDLAVVRGAVDAAAISRCDDQELLQGCIGAAEGSYVEGEQVAFLVMGLIVGRWQRKQSATDDHQREPPLRQVLLLTDHASESNNGPFCKAVFDCYTKDQSRIEHPL